MWMVMESDYCGEFHHVNFMFFHFVFMFFNKLEFCLILMQIMYNIMLVC